MQNSRTDPFCAEAIKWGVLWLYHKAAKRKLNSAFTYEKRNQPPLNVLDGDEEPEYVFDSWDTWETATAEYNGGGVGNYPTRVNSALQGGVHFGGGQKLWPIRTDKAARP